MASTKIPDPPGANMTPDENWEHDEVGIATNKPHPVGHSLWRPFVAFAEENGINLEHLDDWMFSWICFRAGASAERAWGHKHRE